MQELVLANNDTQRYLNASFLTVCWAHLQCQGFDHQKWHFHGEHIFRMILDGANSPLELKSHSAMLAVITRWNQIRAQGQQDLSEFLTFFLGWLNTNLVCQLTERRVELAHGVEVTDKSSAHCPILLHSELWADLQEPQAVLTAWTKVNGMFQAMKHSSLLVCLQVCRFISHGEADFRALDLQAASYQIDVFTDDMTCTVSVDYCIVALVVYTGNSYRG